MNWLQEHRGAVPIAAMLAFAGPLTFFAGALSVARTATLPDLAGLAFWWTLYGLAFWGLLLVAGHACERLATGLGRLAGSAMWIVAGGVAAGLATMLASERSTILIEQGLVHSALRMHLHGFTISFVMALLFFAHLRRSREHAEAAVRLSDAQAVQRDIRRRAVEARLQEMQARVDPGILFSMLDHVKRLYDSDPSRADRLLDELIAFLRAALPRLRAPSSSVSREIQLASAFVQLHGLVAGTRTALESHVAAEAMHARFPPGVLMPLLNGITDVGAGARGLKATCEGDVCRVVLTADVAPSPESIARVRCLLADLYGAAGTLDIDREAGVIHVIVAIPDELA